MLKTTSIAGILALLLFACNQPAKTDAESTSGVDTTEAQAPTVGNDRDEHGCIGSAGYQWSQIKNECVRLFEVGIRLNPAGAAGVDTTTSAFVIFKDDNSVAEVFMPTAKDATLLNKQDVKGHVWSSGALSLSHDEKGYSLKEGDKLLYAAK